MAKTTLGKLVAMATKKRLSLTYELENFANTYLEKGTKFQGDGLFRFGVLSNLLAWRWKPPSMNRVKRSESFILLALNLVSIVLFLEL